MATLATTNPTLLDLAKLKDPDGTITDIVEILNQTNGVLEDISFMEGNLDTGHRHTMRTGIPAPTYTKLYGGVQPTTSSTVQVTDTCAMLEAYCEVDKRLADMADNKEAWRLSEDVSHIEGFAQEVANGIFVNDESTSPEKFTGLRPRYNSLSADNADNIINAAGSDNNQYEDIWIVGWGPRACTGIVPKGSVAGLQVRDLGEDTKVNSDGSMYQVYRTHMMWNVGIALRDWRKVVRVANIDGSLLEANSGLYTPGTGFANSCSDLTDLLHRAISRLPGSSDANRGGERYCIYMSRRMYDSLRRQVSAKTIESTLTWENAGGTMIERFMGYPIKRVDALSTVYTTAVS
jgi:hypothetical protein